MRKTKNAGRGSSTPQHPVRRSISQKAIRSQNRILEAACDLFLKKGYHGTSVRDISRQSGMTIGGVYVHYGDKEAIFRQVLAARHPFFQIFPAIAEVEGQTIPEVFHDFARRTVQALGTQREALNLMFIEIVEFQGRHFQDVFPKLYPYLIEGIRALMARSGFSPRIPVDVAARAFFGVVFSYFMTSAALSDQLPQSDTTLKELIDVYLHGLLHFDSRTDDTP